MKSWLIALIAATGLTWVTATLSHNEQGMDNRPVAPGQAPDTAPKKREGRGSMMDNMGMMGGGMMDACPMMNGKRPNDQWQPAPPAR
jgi:hypothetical protein